MLGLRASETSTFDLDVLVAKMAANGCECSERSVSQWDETRVWDPGD